MHEIKLDSPGRRKIKFCPCDKDNRDGKFTPFVGYDKFGHCHGCDKTFFPSKDKDFKTFHTVSEKSVSKTPIPFTVIPNDLVKANVCEPGNANLIKWLSCELRRERAEKPFTIDQIRFVIKQYHIRGSYVYRNGVAFVYADIHSNVRQIKVMGYNASTGKRIKEPFPEVSQIGKKIVEEAGIANVNIVPCFFGEHLLAANNLDVYIFESEATAIYASVFFRDKVCLATGGKNGCKWDKPEQYEILRGRRVALWPDIDAHEEWTIKAATLKKNGIEVNVSGVIVIAAKRLAEAEGRTYEEFKAVKFDLRDVLIYKEPPNQPLLTPPDKLVTVRDLEPEFSDSIREESESFEEMILRLQSQKVELPAKFDPHEYQEWFNTIAPPTHPTEIDEQWPVCNAVAFVSGRLNHIRVFTDYREQGNRSIYINQLQKLRNKLTS